jgi:hypothetical protein
VPSFVQNAVQPTFIGLLVHRNYGLFGNAGIVGTVARSSLKMANWQKSSERIISGKNVKQ